MAQQYVNAALAFMAALFAGYLAQEFYDRGRRVFAAVFALAALLAIAFLAVPASARDNGRFAASPLKPWFDSLRSKGGASCCSDADGWALLDADWESRDGRYRVRVPAREFIPSKEQPAPPAGADMVWVDVDDSALITEPNRIGRTMVWPTWGWYGIKVRCFMPGAMT